MKKSLIAMALVSAFAAPAFAQGVQVYGTVDMGVSVTDVGAGNKTELVSGGQTDSHIGFKGGEDLGGGLKASFVLEANVAMDSGATETALFSRQSWVGISTAKMGEVRLGRQDTVVRSVARTLDPNGLGLAGDARHVLLGGDLAGRDRQDNTVTYIAPDMGGLKLQAQYGMGEVEGSSSEGSTMGLSASYTAGPLMVTGAYADKKDSRKDTLVGGSYDLGAAKLLASWNESKDEVTSVKTEGYLLGVSAPMGAGSVMASWGKNEVKGRASSDTNVYSLAYTHSLSKRTNMYASYAYLDNDANTGLGGASANGESVTKFSVGVRHSF